MQKCTICGWISKYNNGFAGITDTCRTTSSTSYILISKIKLFLVIHNLFFFSAIDMYTVFLLALYLVSITYITIITHQNYSILIINSFSLSLSFDFCLNGCLNAITISRNLYKWAPSTINWLFNIVMAYFIY